MKKLSIIFLLLLSSYTFSQPYPHITELRGLEDSLTNTHLFYRYITPFTGCWSKSIYHFDLLTNLDTLIIYDAASDPIGEGCRGDYVYDYEFFDSDPSKFIYCGYDFWIDPVALLRRYDGDIHIETFVLTELEISKLNENLVYVSAGPGFFKSTDGGYNFEFNDSSQLIDASIISLGQNDDSHIYGINDNHLVRSDDDGLSYIIVDNSLWSENSELFYDSDSEHIYGLSGSYNYQIQSYLFNIYVSDDNGNPFTWNNIFEYQGKVWFTHDQIQSGEIYYSASRKIFKSTDYGNSFIFYKELDRNITGLYKKSGTQMLYASTTLKIYEITPDTIQVIKSLPIPDEVLSLYPLTVGNKWVYNYLIDPDDPGLPISTGIYVREVLKDTLLENGKVYAKVFDQTLDYFNNPVYERVDSTSGRVYRYLEDNGLENNEFVVHELLAEVGDTVSSSRNFYGQSLFTTVEQLSSFKKWGLTKPKKIYQEYSLSMLNYSLTEDIGLDSLYFIFDFGYGWTQIKGCIINGVVYGDTTVVSVENDITELAIEFSLSQNYPNPFNPSTKIKFNIPHTDNPLQGGARGGLVTLKVYDILGNEIATLVNEGLSAGEYEVEFTGHSDEGQNLPSGIYFYQLKTGSFIQTKKMVLLK